AGLGSLAGVAGLAVLTAAAALGMLAWVQRSGLPASREPSPSTAALLQLPPNDMSVRLASAALALALAFPSFGAPAPL
ncbi:hypothetical protein ABTE09_21340, partial [Acinetobacter baumannii]